MKNLDSAISLAEKLEHVYVATADASGLPHVAAAGQLARVSNDHVAVAAWFCPGTLANLDVNLRISLVIWDPASDAGYQLLGEVEKVEEQAIMNGFLPGSESGPPMPQVERSLMVRVDRIIGFSHAPHSDMEF